MDKDLPKIDDIVAKGELLPIREWLTETVHQNGVQKCRLSFYMKQQGEGLNAKYLADYLQEKYTKL